MRQKKRIGLRVFAVCLSMLFVLFFLVACDEENGAATPQHSHEWSGWTIAQQPTCTENGKRERSCACGAKDEESIPKTGHLFSEAWSYSATEHWHMAVCGHDDVTDARGVHALKDGECSVCGYIRGENPSDPDIPDGATVGLEYRAVPGKQEYMVTGIGTALGTQIVIPESFKKIPVTQIAEGAFYEEAGIEEVVLPEGLTSIGNQAFSGCPDLQTVNLPEGIVSVGASAFARCSALSEVFVQKAEYGVRVFGACEGLKKAEFASGMTKVPESMFADCSALEEVILPDSIVSVEGDAFFNCTALVSVDLPENLETFGGCAFYGCSALQSVSVPAKVGTLPSQLFQNCEGLREVSLPAGLTVIMDSVFSGCSALGEIAIPAGVSSVGGSAFKDCTSLATVSLPAGLEKIERFAFSGCSSLSEISLPDSLTSIGDSAFEFCTALEAIEIPAGVQEIGEIGTGAATEVMGGVFAGCNALASITVEQGNERYYAEGNCLIDREHKLLIAGCKNSVIPEEGVTAIGNGAFRWHFGLTEIKIPDSVIEIGMYAFEACTGLTRVDLGEGVERIGTFAFYSCTSLDRIVIPESVTDIYLNAFSYCSALTEVFACIEHDYYDWAKAFVNWAPPNVSPHIYWLGEWEYDAQGVPVPLAP